MKSHVDTSLLSAMKIGGITNNLSIIKGEEDILKLEGNHLVVGGGTNVVFGDKLEGLKLAKMEIMGRKIIKEDLIELGAGEDWDEFVEFAVKRGFSGAEALSGIPGTVGASPIQNIGAYGSEVKDILVRVEAYDSKEKEFVKIENKDCGFSYRDSIFKQNPRRWIVTKVLFQLSKREVEIPKYKDVEKYFEDKEKPTLSQIRETIIEIRKNKLPDPKVVPNCGSFFKNPFVSEELAEKIKKEFPAVPTFPAGNLIKIPAGFLIEKVGLKGKSIGKIKIYENNALVLTNPGGATFSDLLLAKNTIQEKVFQKFGITLEPEVNIVENK